MRILKFFFGAWISLTPVALVAQETEVHDHESEKKNEIGLFAGGLTNLEAKETGPSVGAEYFRELSRIISVGVIGEFAKAGEREALVAGALVVKAGDNFRVVLAPGVIIEEKEGEHDGDAHDAEMSSEGSSRETRFVARIGVGYSFELSNVVLTPIVYFDLLEGVEDAVDAHLVYGVSIAFPF